MKHNFKVKLEGVEIPFSAFTINAGRHGVDAVVTVPPTPAFFYLLPGTRMVITYIDPIFKKEVALADGVFVGASYSKTAGSLQIDLNFTSPFAILLSYLVTFLSFTDINATEKYIYDLLLQKLTKDSNQTNLPIISQSLEVLQKLTSSTFGEYINGVMSSVINSGKVPSWLDELFKFSNRWKIFANNIKIASKFKIEGVLNYFWKRVESSSPITVGDYIQNLLSVISYTFSGQGFMIDGNANIVFHPIFFFLIPPSTNVFYSSQITTLQLSVSHTLPTRVLEIFYADTIPFFGLYPKGIDTSITADEKVRFVYPYIDQRSTNEVVAYIAGQEQGSVNQDKNALDNVTKYFAAKTLRELYAQRYTGSLKTPFYPYALIGFPSFILAPNGNYFAVLDSARHEYSVLGEAASFFTFQYVMPADMLKKESYIGEFSGIKAYYDEFGIKPAGEKSIKDSANECRKNYNITSSKMTDKYIEELFWWSYENNTKNLKVGAYNLPISNDEVANNRKAVVEKIANFLTQNPITDPQQSAKLENDVLSYLESKNLIDKIYPTFWLEGLEWKS